MNTWDLRAELLNLTHRWYLILAFLLVGGLVGWLLGYILPGPYRASKDLFVALDPHRATQDDAVAMAAQVESFRNLDDYKNWQMNQLNTIIFTDEYLQATLETLQSQNPHWEGQTTGALHDALSVRWRNAGRWVLVAETDREEWARQLVEAWADVIIERVNRSIAHAREVLLLEQQLETLAEIQINLHIRQQELDGLRDALLVWRDDLESYPGESLDTMSRWELYYLVAKAADGNAGWQNLLEGIPPSGALPSEYLPWLDQAILSVEIELQGLPDRLTSLEEQRTDLDNVYLDEVKNSQALSAHLNVEELSDDSVTVNRVRSKGIGALIGLALGVITWAAWALLTITQRVEV